MVPVGSRHSSKKYKSTNLRESFIIAHINQYLQSEGLIIKKKLMDILACPIDKHFPLELHVFEETDEIAEGVILCPKCSRWYPIRDEIPEMLPDELRNEKDELPFMKKWRQKFPNKIITEGKPFNIGKSS